jgi:NAD(P)-dependent dehydrogenase (short-subunit alcohol dehydrogenase family)
MTSRTVLIVGATGVVGHAALEHFAALPSWRVVTMSRRRPELPDGFTGRHLSVDLLDPQACAQALQSEPGSRIWWAPPCSRSLAGEGCATTRCRPIWTCCAICSNP